MNTDVRKERHTLEIMLVIVALGMAYLVYRMGPFKMVALNLFFLPIVLSGYFLGRSSAGILALFCALCVTVATTLDATGFAAYSSPIMMALALTVWAAVLGLTAILVGTLCDERAAKLKELHEAYVGIVEVLSRYLQSGNPKVKVRATRIAELAQTVAEEMKLSRKDVDDIRVGALLYDLGSLEITTKVISRAVDTLEASPSRADKHTFLGLDLVHSLGSVLHGAVPLLLNQNDSVQDVLSADEDTAAMEVPLGARIIKAARAFDAHTNGVGTDVLDPRAAIQQIRREQSDQIGEEVLGALERAVRRLGPVSSPQPAFV